jgi:hypothetical protein
LSKWEDIPENLLPPGGVTYTPPPNEPRRIQLKTLGDLAKAITQTVRGDLISDSHQILLATWDDEAEDYYTVENLEVEYVPANNTLQIKMT